jgi:hypothetical protein
MDLGTWIGNAICLLGLAFGFWQNGIAKRKGDALTNFLQNAEKQPTGPGPEDSDENGPAAALLSGEYASLV